MIHWTDTISTDWHRAHSRVHRWIGRIVGRLAESANRLHLWRERAAGRKQLLTLDDRMLKDIGISRADASKEACKPFWKR